MAAPACQVVERDGIKKWLVEGKPHCEDGPAVEWIGVAKQWRRRGNLHREDGPAVEWVDGDKEWWLKGKRHCEDGPAFEAGNGIGKEWWVDGVKYTEEDFPEAVLAYRKRCGRE